MARRVEDGSVNLAAVLVEDGDGGAGGGEVGTLAVLWADADHAVHRQGCVRVAASACRDQKQDGTSRGPKREVSTHARQYALAFAAAVVAQQGSQLSQVPDWLAAFHLLSPPENVTLQPPEPMVKLVRLVLCHVWV